MAFHLIHIKNEANKSLNRFGLTFSLKSNPMNGFYTPSITFHPQALAQRKCARVGKVKSNRIKRRCWNGGWQGEKRKFSEEKKSRIPILTYGNTFSKVKW